MRKNEFARTRDVEFACRSGLWSPMTFADALPGDVFDAYSVRCNKCGHELRANQTTWQYKHERKCATSADLAAAAQRGKEANDKFAQDIEASHAETVAMLRSHGVEV